MSPRKRQLRFAVPKGHMFEQVRTLLADAGLKLRVEERGYRPTASDPDLEIKLLRAQNIPQLVHLGSMDIAFAGHDWVRESRSKVVEVLDCGLDPVSIVAAAPRGQTLARLRRRKQVVAASEYRNLTSRWLRREDISHVIVQTFGATEVFPPEDADLIVDNTATGTTLRKNHLDILATLLTSSTRFLASQRAMADRWKRKKIEDLALLLQAVLDARARSMLEMNISAERLDRLVAKLPCMRSPTVAPLFGDEGFAVKVAVPRKDVAALVLRLKELGATDIIETRFEKVLP